MKTTDGVLALLLISTLAGCVTARATMLIPSRGAPVPEDQVFVYLDSDELPDGCVRVALIHAQGNVDITHEQQMIRAAKRRAGKVGANAIVLERIRDPSTGTRVAAEVFGLPADRKGQMIAYHCPPAGR
jgi:hypothetical protein